MNQTLKEIRNNGISLIVGVSIGYVCHPIIQCIMDDFKREDRINKENSFLIEKVIETAAGKDKMAISLSNAVPILYPNEQAALIPSSGARFPRLRVGENPLKGKFRVEVDATRMDMFSYLEKNNSEAYVEFQKRFEGK